MQGCARALLVSGASVVSRCVAKTLVTLTSHISELFWVAHWSTTPQSYCTTLLKLPSKLSILITPNEKIKCEKVRTHALSLLPGATWVPVPEAYLGRSPQYRSSSSASALFPEALRAARLASRMSGSDSTASGAQETTRCQGLTQPRVGLWNEEMSQSDSSASGVLWGESIRKARGRTSSLSHLGVKHHRRRLPFCLF